MNKAEEPSHYFARPPHRRFPSIWAFGRLSKTLAYLLLHTFSRYDPAPSQPTAFAADVLKGSFDKDQLSWCRSIFDTEDHRRDKLETKSTSALSLVAVLTPLIVSAAVYIRASDLTSNRRLLTLIVCGFAFVSLFAAFIAALRGTGIRSYQSLYIDALIDTDANLVKAPDPDSWGRGPLWCASVNGAMNNHIADFVKATHMFLVIAVIFLVFAAIPALIAVRPSRNIGGIAGTVLVDAPNLQNAVTSIAQAVSSLNHPDKEGSRVEALETEVANLRARVQSTEQQLSAKDKQRRHKRKKGWHRARSIPQRAREEIYRHRQLVPVLPAKPGVHESVRFIAMLR